MNRQMVIDISTLFADNLIGGKTGFPAIYARTPDHSADNHANGRDCQHTLLSHFHGACRFAAGSRRYSSLFFCGFDRAFCVRRDPSTLSSQ
jgi:hypothetical protein